VLGIAVLASVFSSHGSYVSPQGFVDGLVPAMWVGTGVLAAGALVAAVLPFNTRSAASETGAASRNSSSVDVTLVAA
jgi:hypothetical protein